MHRLIQEEVITFTENEIKYDKDLETNEKILKSLIYYFEEQFGYVGNDPKEWKKYNEIYIQAANIINSIFRRAISVEINSGLAKKILNFEIETSKITKNFTYCIKLIENETKFNDIDHPSKALDLCSIGTCYIYSNSYQKAL